MAIALYRTIANGINKLVAATVASTGVADAGKIVGLNELGKLDVTLMPTGIGANTILVMAKVKLHKGAFVGFQPGTGGNIEAVLADNAGVKAEGFVLEEFGAQTMATIYPMVTENNALVGMTPGARYYLGTAGNATLTPLPETAGTGKIHQYLGKATATNAIAVYESDPVTL